MPDRRRGDKRGRRRAWIALMTKDDLARAWHLAETTSEVDLMAMARERDRKDSQIALWFLASCAAPLLVMLVGVLAGVPTITANPLPWIIAMVAAILLPLPAMKVGKDGHREGRIIALAYWIKRGEYTRGRHGM